MLKLMAHAKKIPTDSGGVQKEAYMFGVPCITMRENTGWVETVEDGGNVLAGEDYEKIKDAILNFEGAEIKGDVFGTGNACADICDILNEHLLQTSVFET